MELFEELKTMKPSVGYSAVGKKYKAHVSIEKYQTRNPLINKTLWDNIGFNKRIDIDIDEECNGFREAEKITDIVADKAKQELKKEWLEFLKSNKERILKLVDKRTKQYNYQQNKKKQADNKKDKDMYNYGEILIKLGYQVSKVHSGSYYYGDISVSDRSVADKWHKYINTENITNIKFATVEFKINKSGYKIGFKIETKGQIGCSFEELEYVYNQLKIEKEKLTKALQ